MSAIIVIFHTPSNAGYAMTPLEKIFFQTGCELFGGQVNVHFAFKNLDKGMPESLPDDFTNVIALDTSAKNQENIKEITKYIKYNNISTALVFDLQVKSPICTLLRTAGVQTLISYWGAPISGENTKLKLFFKRIEVTLEKNKPDLFIFESEAMRHLAVNGRGIHRDITSVIPTGVDTERFKPDLNAKNYIAQNFNLPENNKIIFYSGHMEERKGVRIIIDAAIKLIDEQNLNNWHFLICGNRPGEEKQFLDILEGTTAANHVIFAGYRSDLDKIIPGCELGVVASTGWDSFPMSCLEMASCGLPLVVSNLQGLSETLKDGETGYLFKPGNSSELANIISIFDKDEELHAKFSNAARKRILESYSLEKQKESLKVNINEVMIK